MVTSPSWHIVLLKWHIHWLPGLSTNGQYTQIYQDPTNEEESSETTHASDYSGTVMANDVQISGMKCKKER